MIIHRPLPNIETALSELETAFDRLQGNLAPAPPPAEPAVDRNDRAVGYAGREKTPAGASPKDHLNLN